MTLPETNPFIPDDFNMKEYEGTAKPVTVDAPEGGCFVCEGDCYSCIVYCSIVKNYGSIVVVL